MITLIIEDGSRPAGANTFVDLVDAQALAEQDARMAAYLAAADDEARKLALTTAFAWLRRYDVRLKGRRTGQQEGIFPRVLVTWQMPEGRWIDAMDIPAEVKRAQLLAASAQLAGRPLDGVPAAGSGITEIAAPSSARVVFGGAGDAATRDAADPAPAVAQELMPFLTEVRR